MKVIKCWDIQVWDGGDRHNHKYYVATKEAADEWMAKNKYDAVYEKEFVILDDLGEIEAFKNGELRKRALAKLTDAEKVVLGLK
jgi:nucleoside-triphosphatase THEP1